ncbi:MAG TPA: ABC transporter substrate-binding protein [Acidimicrobiales bacterium]|nr:ABC transporter substrate-binding protein [Acidimicrobiales bacterium]
MTMCTRHPAWRAVLAALACSIAAAMFLLVPMTVAHAQAKPFRIGVIYDYSGPFAAGGSVAAAKGTEVAIEMVNEKGGILGRHKVEAIIADAQSKADIAINEAERLLSAEKVDALVGIYASAEAVPLVGKVDQQQKILWLGVPSATGVIKDRNLRYVFRCLPHSDQFGELSPQFLAENSKAKFGIEPKDLKVAIIYEDGPYGSGAAAGNERGVQKQGLKLVFKEGYAATAPDLSALVTKLRRAQPDVILHTGYNPDITLFLRQAREQGLRFKALIGHGAGYSQIDKLWDTFKTDSDYFLNIDPPSAQLMDPKKLAPGLGDLIQEFIGRYVKKTGISEVSPQATSGFSFTWIFLTQVVPNAVQKYGDWSSESIRKAALDLEIPDGGTISGFGVKFLPPGDPMSGQNLRAFPVIMQYKGGKASLVYPSHIAATAPVLPLPASSPYAAR